MKVQKFSLAHTIEIVAVSLLLAVGTTSCGTVSAQQSTTTLSPSLSNRIELRKKERQTLAQKIEDSVREQKAARMKKLNDLKSQMSKIQNSNAKNKAEKLNTQIAKVNAVHTTNELRFLDHLAKILDKIEDRTDKVEQTKVNVSTVRASINVARNDLDGLRTKIVLQQEKVYVVAITNDQSLGSAYKTAIHQLRDDHHAIRTDLKTASNKVRDCLQVLKSLVPKTPLATNSPQ